MGDLRKVDSRDYYDFLPPNTHRTGDIWKGLPTFGMLDRTTSPGIVITPACDLANKKCETITYVPIVSVIDHLNSPAFYYELWTEIAQMLVKVKLDHLVITPDRFDLPLLDDIDKIISVLSDRSQSDEKGILARLQAYRLYILSHIKNSFLPIEDMAGIYQRNRLGMILRKIITNSHRAEIHFLPSDEKVESGSVITGHSVALFRFALSLPISVLNIAESSNSVDWTRTVDHSKKSHPVLNFIPQCPIRMVTLKGEFLSDLLSRYIAMYVRLGSRDFTDDTVNRYAMDLGS